MLRYSGIISIMLCVTMFTGCAESVKEVSRPKFTGTLVPVSGTVRIDGKPHSGVTVIFVPEDDSDPMKTGGIAVTNEEGKYILHHQSGQDGIEAGKYKVIFSKAVMPDGSDVPTESTSDAPPDANARELFPNQYTKVDETLESATVSDSGGEFNFDIKLEE